MSDYLRIGILMHMIQKNYAKPLFDCIAALNPVAVRGGDVTIAALSYDSREIQKGTAFFALPGIHTDGSLYIDAAIKQGAVAVFHEKDLPVYNEDVCYIQVRDVRVAMADTAAAFFEHPSRDMIVIGVTGTEGKTSTVSFIYQLLNLAGKKAGFFSTVSYSLGGEVVPNPAHQTTPESTTVQERLAAMRDNGCQYAVVESSSHGLSPKTARLLHVAFDVAVFMNVTQEHLEFHGTFEQYRFDKAALFRGLDSHNHKKTCGSVEPFGVVNLEDLSAEYFAKSTPHPVYGFSTQGGSCSKELYRGALYAGDIMEEKNGIRFTVHTGAEKNASFEAAAPVSGAFNVYNILASLITVGNLLNTPPETLLPLLAQLKAVTGRMCTVDVGQDFEVLIDYAHTPSSFELILPPIQKRVKNAGGKVIAVFGSGGERDTVKRPEQGRLAGKYCDYVILADEDPRGEDSVELLEMIAAGCPEKKRNETLFIIPHRPDAIAKAVSLAQKNDCILLLGKGHENSIIYKDYTMPYDEYAEAEKALRNR